MKKIGFIILFTMLLCAGFANAEVDVFFKAKYDGAVVKLRWYPTDKNLNYEYKLYRTEGYKTKSQPVLLTTLKMASYEDAKKKLNRDAKHELKLLYPFETAKNGKEKNAYLTQMENRTNMLFLVSMLKPDIAELIGQYYLDHQIEKDKVYTYTVKTYRGGQEILSRDAIVSTKRPHIPSGAWGVVANKFPWGVGLKWKGYEGFLGFNIFRAESADGTYKKINKSPVQVQEMVNPDGTVEVAPYFYTDKNIKEGKIYYYKVQALDIFGDSSPDSEIVLGAVKKDSMPGVPKAPTLEVEEKQILVKWESIKDETIRGYNIYRSVTQDGNYLKLNEKPLAVTNFLDTKVIVDTNYFYTITSVNQGGFESKKSLSTLGVPTDITPPAIVQGVKVSLDGTKVKLSWKGVADNDLLGYRIYRTINTNNKDWGLMNKDAIVENDFTDALTKNLSRYPFYYRITSIDTHFNESEPSEELKIQLPDVSPPRAPVLSDYSVVEGQVSLVWGAVEVYDFAGYNVYRFLGGKKQKVNTVPLLSSFYVDKSPPIDKELRYSVVTIDKTGNESTPSNALSLTVRDSLSPHIQSFKASVVANDKSKKVVLAVESKDKGLNGFDVLKSRNNREFVKINSSRVKGKTFADSNILTGKRYYYKVVLWDSAANKTESMVRIVKIQ